MPRQTRADQAARRIAEALSTGVPLAALPPEIAPHGRAEGERVALLALASLGIAPCGLRMANGITGPMIEGRLLPEGATAAGLHHPVVTAALIGVLAEALDPAAEGPPIFSAIRAALDLADRRFSMPPTTAAQRAADLGGLGLVVAGPPFPPPPDGVMVETRSGVARTDMALAFGPVAAAARRLGGLPAGSLLVAAGLSAPITADGAGRLVARFGALGAVSARLG
jgi:hypothetical protein